MSSYRRIHAETVFPLSPPLITASVQLAIGTTAIASMTFQIGPFI
jgi:hypothetical protein